MTRKDALTSIPLLFVLAALTACGGGGGGGGGGGSAGLIALPKTGQTTCSDAAGTTIACAGTGQDGDLQTGVAGPSSRFTLDVTGACITDSLTGLMWTRNANLPAGAGAATTGARTWQQSLDYANTLDLCGFTDWRLSNPNELSSLVNFGVADQVVALNGLGFNNVQANVYWSSSSYVASAAHAWIVNIFDGSVDASIKTSSFYVWPVRAGQ